MENTTQRPPEKKGVVGIIVDEKGVRQKIVYSELMNRVGILVASSDKNRL